jgi:ATP-dependent Clp protease ATP-binding subunit ClpA
MAKAIGIVNRVDEIVVFHSLSEEDLRKILEIQLERLRTRLQNATSISS